MINNVISHVRWSLWRRVLLQRKIRGFKASILSYCNEACSFEEYVAIGRDVSLTDVSVGRFSYIVSGVARAATIGNFCSIGQGVKIGGFATHPRFVTTHPSFFSEQPPVAKSFKVVKELKHFRPVIIGHDVWIGDRAMILDGVSVGTGAIVGAGAVVPKDVGPYEVVVGVPATRVRTRIPEELIPRMLLSKWWTWSVEELALAAPTIGAADYERFLDLCESLRRK